MAKEIIRESRRRRQLRLFWRLIIFLLISSAAATTFFIFLDQKLKIKNIIITGNERIETEQITAAAREILERKKFFIFSGDNILLVNSQNLSRELKEKIAAIDELNVERDFGQKELRLELKERKGWAVWCRNESEECFYIDEKGVIFRAAPRFYGDLVLKIMDSRSEILGPGKTILDPELLKKIREFQTNIFQVQGIAINTIEISPDLVFKLGTRDGWHIILDSQTDTVLAAENLKLLLSSAIKDGAGELDYIDLRFPDKSFFKFK